MHCVMQGKGGVGKSFVAYVLAQWLRSQNHKVQAFDTDPVNATFASFKSLAAQHIDILIEDQINAYKIDGIFTAAMATPDATTVIDNGAASFLPMMQYLLHNGTAEMLRANKRRLVLHTLAVGGQLALETMRGVEALLSDFDGGTVVIVWVNELAGRFEAEGLKFEETLLYLNFRERLKNRVIYLPYEHPQMAGRDMRVMLSKHLTFDEAMEDPSLSIPQRQRLTNVRRHLFGELEKVMADV